jgi:hypothetical protein
MQNEPMMMMNIKIFISSYNKSTPQLQCICQVEEKLRYIKRTKNSDNQDAKLVAEIVYQGKLVVL